MQGKQAKIWNKTLPTAPPSMHICLQFSVHLVMRYGPRWALNCVQPYACFVIQKSPPPPKSFWKKVCHAGCVGWVEVKHLELDFIHAKFFVEVVLDVLKPEEEHARLQVSATHKQGDFLWNNVKIFVLSEKTGIVLQAGTWCLNSSTV